jgi:hypothetical protein
METGAKLNANTKTQFGSQAVLWQLKKLHIPKRKKPITFGTNLGNCFYLKKPHCTINPEEKEHTQARLGAEKVLGDHDHIRGCFSCSPHLGTGTSVNPNNLQLF